MVSTIALGMLLIIQSVIHHLHSKSQQGTIQSLTDRLMSRDYREFRSMTPVQMQEEKLRDPMSWYDDPLINDAE